MNREMMLNHLVWIRKTVCAVKGHDVEEFDYGPVAYGKRCKRCGKTIESHSPFMEALGKSARASIDRMTAKVLMGG